MKKYIENEDYFLKIDDEKKAYWLGFLYADGCVSIGGKNKNKYTTTIMLHPKDKYILELFLKDIKSNRSVSTNKKGYVFVIICGKRFSENLIKLGCVPKKSNILKFPTVDVLQEKFKKDFIRGYMDGDGCISVYAKERKNRPNKAINCEVKFIGTFSMLDGIRAFFNSPKKILINKHSPTSYQISFAGRKYSKIVDLLYDQAERYLIIKKEKWDLYKNYINIIDNKIMTTKEFIIINKLETKKRININNIEKQVNEENREYKFGKFNKYKFIEKNRKFKIKKLTKLKNKEEFLSIDSFSLQEKVNKKNYWKKKSL